MNPFITNHLKTVVVAAFYMMMMNTNSSAQTNHWYNLNSPTDCPMFAVQPGGSNMYCRNTLTGSIEKFYRKQGTGTWNLVTTDLPTTLTAVYGVWALNSGTLLTILAGTPNPVIYRSTNFGTHWTAVDSTITGANFNLVENAAGEVFIYNYIGSGNIRKGTSDGQSWSTPNNTLGFMKVQSSGTDLYGISNTTGWAVQKSTDGGSTWNLTPSTGNTGGNPSNIGVGPNGIIYIQNNSGSDSVYKSSDGGNTWHSLSLYTGGNFFVDGGNNLFQRFEPTHIYRSTDAGVNFTDVIDSLGLSGTVSIQYIILSPVDSSVYVSTIEGGVTRRFFKYGTGAGPAPSFVQEMNAENHSSIFPNPANNFFSVKENSPSGYFTELKIAEVSGKIILEKNISNISPGIPIDVSTLPNGIYIVSFRGHEKVLNQKLIITGK